MRVEPDKIEILSFPGPDRSITIEGLRNYRVVNRRYRNRRIGEFLKELHLTEGRNTGFGKILRALEKNGSPKPEFETDENRNYFITRLYIKDNFLNKKNSQNVVQNIKIDVKTKKRRERLLKILEIISENSEITIEELAIKLNKTKYN